MLELLYNNLILKVAPHIFYSANKFIIKELSYIYQDILLSLCRNLSNPNSNLCNLNSHQPSLLNTSYLIALRVLTFKLPKSSRISSLPLKIKSKFKIWSTSLKPSQQIVTAAPILSEAMVRNVQYFVIQDYTCQDCCYNENYTTMCYCKDCFIFERHIGHNYYTESSYSE